VTDAASASTTRAFPTARGTSRSAPRTSRPPAATRFPRDGNTEAGLENAVDVGVGLIDDDPGESYWGFDITFLHPDSTGGVLVEFVEH
jgi:hypothetical protein